MAVAVDENPLGTFLTARRAAVLPEDVGLPSLGRRRVPGLRREELALLAGISLNYLVRLERGRDRNPSPSVLDALAAALRLDEQAAAHLHALGGSAPPRRAPAEEVRPGIRRLVDAWTDQPVFVLGRLMDVLAANALAEALHPGFRAGTNLMRFVFLDPRARERYGDWDAVAEPAVGTLRATAGTALDEPAVRDLVDELLRGSDDFRRLWARHEVREKDTGRKRFEHPDVGPVVLDFESFAVTGSPGQLMVVYSAEPGSADERALRSLAG